jgi:hypothetical protein
MRLSLSEARSSAILFVVRRWTRAFRLQNRAWPVTFDKQRGRGAQTNTGTTLEQNAFAAPGDVELPMLVKGG